MKKVVYDMEDYNEEWLKLLGYAFLGLTITIFAIVVLRWFL